jgi:hypothetical protein
VKARRQFAGPSHQVRILNSRLLRSRFANDRRRQNTESIQPWQTRNPPTRAARLIGLSTWRHRDA